ncbi:hypothetical protein ACOSP7_019266 [Xanthoceras sorbifolium]
MLLLIRILGKIGLGVVTRNWHADLVLAAGISVSNVLNVAEAEAKAILEGARLAVARGLVTLCIESDALNVVKLCNGISSTKCSLDNIIHDIHVICKSFDIVSISHIFRNCNMVARNIFKWALDLNSSTIWFNAFPSWLRKLVVSDVALSVGPNCI